MTDFQLFPAQKVAIADTLYAWSEATYPVFTVGGRAGKTTFLLALADHVLKSFNWLENVYFISATENIAKDAVRQGKERYDFDKRVQIKTMMGLQAHVQVMKRELDINHKFITPEYQKMKNSIFLFDEFYFHSPALMTIPDTLVSLGCRHICVIGNNWKNFLLHGCIAANHHRYASWDWNPLLTDGAVAPHFAEDFKKAAYFFGLWDSNDMHRKIYYIKRFAPPALADLYRQAAE